MADVEAFVREFTLPFPILLDESGDVAKQRYRLRAVPMSVFVDRDGTITRVYVGEMSGEQIDQFVDEILP